MYLTIVTRQSRLALAQTNIVKNLLLQHEPGLQINIMPVSTTGDRILDQSLVKIGGKGLFVKELEQQLLNGTADLAVHSLKDMPAELPAGLAIGAILPRADPRDTMVSHKYTSLQDLPVGAKIGTSSLRRQAQILAQRPDLEILALRGNVETRVNKLLANDFDAIILAVAGLDRLQMQQWITCPLPYDILLPAVGQGALAVEYAADRQDIAALLQKLDDSTTRVCVTAERSMNAILDAGCQAPVAGLATINNAQLSLSGLVASVDGRKILRVTRSAAAQDAANLGATLAQDLIAQGAKELIAEAKQLWD